jgi:hypothetical protein
MPNRNSGGNAPRTPEERIRLWNRLADAGLADMEPRALITSVYGVCGEDWGLEHEWGVTGHDRFVITISPWHLDRETREERRGGSFIGEGESLGEAEDAALRAWCRALGHRGDRIDPRLPVVDGADHAAPHGPTVGGLPLRLILPDGSPLAPDADSLEQQLQEATALMAEAATADDVLAFLTANGALLRLSFVNTGFRWHVLGMLNAAAKRLDALEAGAVDSGEGERG